MSAGLIGALAGLALALVELVFLRALAGRVDLPETRTALKLAGISQLFLLPVLGYFVASYLLGD